MSEIGGSKMNEIDIENLTGRELDAAVAEAMGWRVVQNDFSLYAYAESGGERIMSSGYLISRDGRYSSEPGAFSYIKREIERRGWRWTCECRCVPLPPLSLFWFEVRIPTNDGNYGEVYRSPAKSEEVAGCRAFLAACKMSRNRGGAE